jgi:antitoxin HigA-1
LKTVPKGKKRPVHPGEILKQEFLKPMAMSARKLARLIGVPPNRVSAIIAGRRGITAHTALLLGSALETTPQFWLTLQSAYDLQRAEATIDLSQIQRIPRRW